VSSCDSVVRWPRSHHAGGDDVPGVKIERLSGLSQGFLTADYTSKDDRRVLLVQPRPERTAATALATAASSARSSKGF
jgi:hypothetical protein